MTNKDIYIDFLKKYIDVKRPLTVVFDASNGTTGMITKDLFKGTNVNVISINDEIDPDFKAHGPNPILQGADEDCKKAIFKNKADAGIIFDGDGDRAFFLDEKGRMMHSAIAVGFFCKEFEPPYILDEPTYQSVRLLKIIPEKDLAPCKVGYFFIKESLREKESSFGAEFSRHFFFKDFFNSDSGIFASIKFLNFLSKSTRKLSDMVDDFGEHRIVIKEIKAEGKDMQALYKILEDKYGKLANSFEKRDGITFIFNDYWINVRTSNTEPIMRIVGGGKGDLEKTIEEMEKLAI